MINRFGTFPLYKKILWVIGGIAFFAVVAFFFGFILMLLWNWLMPDIFGLPIISYWQAWGLVFMAHILFKSMGHHGHERHHQRDDWKEKFKKRFKDGWTTNAGDAHAEWCKHPGEHETSQPGSEAPSPGSDEPSGQHDDGST